MTFHLLKLQGMPIYEQLLIEEQLLRGDERNWCIINSGSTPAIVMGISGKKEELVDTERAAKDKIPLIKRFSGGGTVVVDEGTLFVTFICQKELHSFPAYPEPILRWTEEFYRDVFPQPTFRLQENDYVFGQLKFGGNAQYIKKDRWLHHTSFLWDYQPERMQYLLLPKKRPRYRQDRPHSAFLCRLCEHFPSRDAIFDQVISALGKRYQIEHVKTPASDPTQRQTTTFIDL